MTHYVIRANHGRLHTPSLRYWNHVTHAWGDFDAASRYDHIPRLLLQALTEPSCTVTAEADHDLDIDGFPYVVDEHIGPVRLTHCCAASTSVSDGPLYCKSCYEEVDWAYDGPARLHATDPDGPRGPITITLPPR